MRKALVLAAFLVAGTAAGQYPAVPEDRLLRSVYRLVLMPYF